MKSNERLTRKPKQFTKKTYNFITKSDHKSHNQTLPYSSHGVEKNLSRSNWEWLQSYRITQTESAKQVTQLLMWTDQKAKARLNNRIWTRSYKRWINRAVHEMNHYPAADLRISKRKLTRRDVIKGWPNTVFELRHEGSFDVTDNVFLWCLLNSPYW